MSARVSLVGVGLAALVAAPIAALAAAGVGFGELLGSAAGGLAAAVDAVGWRMIEARRREVGLPTLAAEGREPRWIATAAGLGLGRDAEGAIRVEDL